MPVSEHIQLSSGDTTYTWEEGWAAPPPDALAGSGWAHHGLGVTADQHIIGYQSGGDHMCIFDQDGRLLEQWPTGLVEGHGMALAGPSGKERLWIADPGSSLLPEGTPGVRAISDRELGWKLPWPGYAMHMPVGMKGHGAVVAFDIHGKRLITLPVPELPQYSPGLYAPTAVAVDDGPSGDGSIWVADGYGQSLVHRFSADGELELTLSGEEGAGRFDCPHAVFIDHRRPEPRLYVTDRTNARLQIYTLEGAFLDVVSSIFKSPSALAASDDRLIVAELHARLAVLDADDKLVGYLGEDGAALERAGWPNAIADGRTVRPPDLRRGLFNSPHGLAVDAAGNIYVAEWLIGGRMIRLRRVP